MSEIMMSLSETVLRPAAWALVHFLWQGALVALAVAGALAALRGRSARLRYAVACGGLAVMTLLPFATAFDLATLYGGSGEPAAAPAALEAVSTAPPAPVALGARTGPESRFEPRWLRQRLEPLLPWLFALWLAGVVAIAAAHLGGWRRIRALRRETRPVPERWQAALGRLARRLDLSRTVRLVKSARVQVPVVIGWFRPAILVPASALSGLSPHQLEAVLAHELAHVRRHDYLVNLFQVVVETLLFYHPGVWWMSREIRVERENCCDDLAVRVCGNPVTYARALADLEELRFGSPAFAMGADGGSLLGRVQRLLGRDDKPAAGWLAALVAALVATLVATIGAALLFFASSSSALPAPPEPPPAEATPPAEPTAPVAPFPPAPPSDEGIPAALAPPAPPAAPAPPAPPAAAAPAAPRPPRAAFQLAQAEPREDEAEPRERHRRGWRDDDEWLEDEVEDLRRSVAGTPYDGLTDEELRDLARKGLDEDLIPALVEAGVTGASTGELEDLARYGIDGDDVAEYHAAGYTDLSVDDLVTMARYGLDGEDVAEFHAAGYADLSVDDLVTMARYGLDSEDVADYHAAGYMSLAVDELVELARYGVDGEDVADYHAAGYTDLSVDELVRLGKHGVGGEDVAEYHEAGYTELSIDEIVKLSKHGMDGEDVHEFVEAGLGELSIDDLMQLARYGVDGDDVQEYHETGYTELSVDEIVALARYGVDGDDLEELCEAGQDLSVDEVIRLARRGGLDDWDSDSDSEDSDSEEDSDSDSDRDG